MNIITDFVPRLIVRQDRSNHIADFHHITVVGCAIIDNNELNLYSM